MAGTGVIYIATNLETGRQYVGQTSNFRKRLQEHLSRNIRGKSYFENALRNHGLAVFDFVQIPYPADWLNYWEEYWITNLNTMIPNGYNLTMGGKSLRGFHHSEATKIKLSEAQRGRPKPPWTDERKKKLSLAKKGKPGSRGTGWHHTEEAKRKIGRGNVGRPVSDQERKRRSEAVKGKPWTDARRRASLINEMTGG